MSDLKGHRFPIGAKVQKRMTNKPPRKGVVLEHYWLNAKGNTRQPFYVVLYDDSAKPEKVSGSVLSLQP